MYIQGLSQEWRIWELIHVSWFIRKNLSSLSHIKYFYNPCKINISPIFLGKSQINSWHSFLVVLCITSSSKDQYRKLKKQFNCRFVALVVGKYKKSHNTLSAAMNSSPHQLIDRWSCGLEAVEAVDHIYFPKINILIIFPIFQPSCTDYWNIRCMASVTFHHGVTREFH